MHKEWINRAVALLNSSLYPIPQELNELDWKEQLSPNKERLCEHISAFANHPGGGFLVFGIRDVDAHILGISRDSASVIIQRLADIGRNTLEPPIGIDHSIETFEGKSILLIYIKESAVKPVFKRGGRLEDTWIRTGGTTRQASRHDVGGLLLNSKTPHFEELHATKAKTAEEVLDLLDYKAIFKLLKKTLPSSRDEIISSMIDEKMIESIDGVGYYITNIGALSAAYDLNAFDGLSRKTIRLIRYNGLNKINTTKEYPGKMGYAIGFEGLISFLKDLLPGSEIIKNAFRHETSVYPLIALRELIANALIHQDLTVRGAGPMIEVFDDRIEISNPGRLLPSKKIDRLIRTTPESRNEVLASAFRRYYICEERGSGMEKAVSAIELYGLPPLKLEETSNSFRVTMYSPRSFANMTQTERIEACYQHSIIKYYSSDGMTNTSLRERFQMNEKQRSQISRIIRDAIEAGKIKPKDPTSSAIKFALYIPYWG